MLTPYSPIVLKVQRSEPEMIRPARPTPNELKPLADIDHSMAFRINVPVILAYKSTTHILEGSKDPAQVMKTALAEALVYYYPWAGRLTETADGRLMVDCTAEGIVFVEADADVRLDQFGEKYLIPPFPCSAEDLFFLKPADIFSVIACPMLTIQLTRLLCGGFIVAFNFSHVMTDAAGSVHFLKAVAELAFGASAPSVLPVWQRELLDARDPPRVTCTLPIVDNPIFGEPKLEDDLVCRTFVFSDHEVAALRAYVPFPCTKFEVILACVWRCRIIALKYEPEEEVRLIFAFNFRNKFDPPLIPAGYYGNASTLGICVSLAGEVCDGSFSDAVELVQKAKRAVTEEYVRSLVDLSVMNGRLVPVLNQNCYFVSDVSSSVDAFPSLDFGWGKAVYAGPPDNGMASRDLCFIHQYGDGEGKGKVLSVSLPRDAMDRFVIELGILLKMDLPL